MLVLMPAGVGNSHGFSSRCQIVSGKRLKEVVELDNFSFSEELT
jgi:hypothetical protein